MTVTNDQSKNQIIEQAILSSPLRLKIERIKVDTHIESVNTTQAGAMEVPKDIKNVAWYELGTHPGDVGSAVIAGHYGWKNSKESAFDKLYTLHKGDKVTTENKEGVITSFIVVDIKIFDSSANTKEVFYSNDGKSHLNLITCNGTWNKLDKNYSKRLVIFTDKEL